MLKPLFGVELNTINNDNNNSNNNNNNNNNDDDDEVQYQSGDLSNQGFPLSYQLLCFCGYLREKKPIKRMTYV